jgi:hypothetical protein
VVQAQEGATTLLRQAQSQVDEIQARTEAAAAERVAEAELMVVDTEQVARAEMDRIRAEALADGEAVIARAKDEGRALLEQVQEARRRVLADLATRRRALSIQIEQLRAARDEMAASVHGVRDTVDGILGQLQRSDGEARAAALAAGDQARLHGVGDSTADDVTASEAVTVSETADAASDDPESDDGAPTVDELFARIRAGSDEPGDSVRLLPVAEEEASPAAEPGPDDPLIARRDELLAPVTTQLNRHIKRALGDDQNRLLDVLRSAPSTTGDALLGPEEVHVMSFASAAHGHLADAFSAGMVFAGGAPGSVPPEGAVEEAAGGLARTVVTMLRRRIAEGSEGGEEIGDRVGAAFREWRGERIERLVGDFAVQSFSAGVTAATAGGGTVRWVLTSSQGCSDCDDNALAGAVAVSEGFPTGHPYPPAHSGCRCLVAPSPA